MFVNSKELSDFLEYYAKTMDISETAFEKAEKRYHAIANWLKRDGSKVAEFSPDFYPQGSFMLGTMIRPVTDEEHYDLDMVCQINVSKKARTQEQVKLLIGEEIIEYAKANGFSEKPENNNRCWTLNYSESANFHLDVLPAIPDAMGLKSMLEVRGFKTSEYIPFAIAITDKRHPNYRIISDDWLSSNPKGYGEWFKSRMRVQFDKRRKILVEATVGDVPDYKVKTPLQRVVQILKRHRDEMFIDDNEDKPISIIITTLAAHSYANEEDLHDALINIIRNMKSHIQNRNGEAWIPNPVNESENFADKWREHTQRKDNFYRWLAQVELDFGKVFASEDTFALSESLMPVLGASSVKKAHEGWSKTRRVGVVAKKGPLSISRFAAPHKESLPWPSMEKYPLHLKGRYKQNGGAWKYFRNDTSSLPKHCSLEFQAETNVPKPFSVFWQVVNTGQEATGVDGLRGQIFQAKTAGAGGLKQTESTQYSGMHWIECFIVKDDKCVARSGEYVVNIQ